MEARKDSEGSEEISWSQTLSPLEHKLFGSTPPNMSIEEVNALIGKASRGEDGDAVGELLRPSILNEGISRELVEKARKEKRRIGLYFLFGEKSYDDDFPLKDYELVINNIGGLNKDGLAKGLDVEFIPGKEGQSPLLSEETMFFLLDRVTEESARRKNTIRVLAQSGALDMSFSNTDMKTIMHFRYNFPSVKP